MYHFETASKFYSIYNFGKVKFNFLFLIVFGNLIFFSVLARSQEKCESLFTEKNISVQPELDKDILSTAKNLEENNYTQGRILDEYNAYFLFHQGKDLIQTLAYLRDGSVWFDMGSGRNVALVKGLEKNKQIRRGVGVSATRSEFALGDQRVPGRLKQINGDYLENLVAQGRLENQKGKVDLITEIFGPLTYSQNVVEIMQIYLDLLKTNGQLMITFQISRGKSGNIFESDQIYPYNAIFSEKGLNEYGLFEWMKTIPGVSIEFVEQKTEKESGHYENTMSVRITKLSDQILVPNTIVVDKELPTIPPMRIFAPVNLKIENQL